MNTISYKIYFIDTSGVKYYMPITFYEYDGIVCESRKDQMKETKQVLTKYDWNGQNIEIQPYV